MSDLMTAPNGYTEMSKTPAPLNFSIIICPISCIKALNKRIRVYTEKSQYITVNTNTGVNMLIRMGVPLM